MYKHFTEGNKDLTKNIMNSKGSIRMSQNECETLFTELRALGNRVVDELAGCVQNDINWMKLEGYVTKEDLVKTLPIIDSQFDRAKEDLNTLHEKVIAYYKHHIAHFG